MGFFSLDSGRMDAAAPAGWTLPPGSTIVLITRVESKSRKLKWWISRIAVSTSVIGVIYSVSSVWSATKQQQASYMHKLSCRRSELDVTIPSNCLWTLFSSFRMDVISCKMKQSRGSFRFRLRQVQSNLKETLFEVFRIGTSFSALILASISSQTSALFWKRTL